MKIGDAQRDIIISNIAKKWMDIELLKHEPLDEHKIANWAIVAALEDAFIKGLYVKDK